MIVEEPRSTLKKSAKKKKVAKQLTQQIKPATDYHVHDIEIDPNEEILMEGELLKFKPGFEKNFISRWI
jgi:hypothetical protein